MRKSTVKQVQPNGEFEAEKEREGVYIVRRNYWIASNWLYSYIY